MKAPNAIPRKRRISLSPRNQLLRLTKQAIGTPRGGFYGTEAGVPALMREGNLVERLGGGRAGVMPHVISEALSALRRTLATGDVLQYVWLTLGHLCDRHLSNNDGQRDQFGGISNVENGSDVTAGSTAKESKRWQKQYRQGGGGQWGVEIGAFLR